MESNAAAGDLDAALHFIDFCRIRSERQRIAHLDALHELCPEIPSLVASSHWPRNAGIFQGQDLFFDPFLYSTTQQELVDRSCPAPPPFLHSPTLRIGRRAFSQRMLKTLRRCVLDLPSGVAHGLHV